MQTDKKTPGQIGIFKILMHGYIYIFHARTFGVNTHNSIIKEKHLTDIYIYKHNWQVYCFLLKSY